MRHSLKGICGTVVALGVLLGAMNITNIDDRAGSNISYSQLLSREYQKVSAFLETKHFHNEA